MMLLPTLLLLVPTVLTTVNGVLKIPNAGNILHPCRLADKWPEVGDQDPIGSISPNRFGDDFANNGNAWNERLCRMDSDSDNRTNGEELGDPNCVWVPGARPESTDVTHPAVCEPITSPRCQGINHWLACAKLPCFAFDLDTTEYEDLHFNSKNTVPPNEVSYKCQLVKLRSERDYHLIGSTPILDKPEIIQQIMVFSCDRTMDAALLEKTIPCSMGIEHCRTPIAIWDYGSGGQCHDEKYGFQIGLFGAQYAVLQLHWKNPTHNGRLFEHSGMRIYYTPNKRPFTGQILMVGQQDLDNMPPKTPSISYSGSCGKECTKFLPRSIFVAEAFLHMHRQGKSGSIQLVKGGTTNTIVTEEDYNYNIPKLNNLVDDIELFAGDEIRVNCTYQTLNRDKVIRYGNAAADEMCYGFVTIYPAIQGFDVCSQWRNIPICPRLNEALTYANCDNVTLQTLFEPIQQNCDVSCSPACISLAARLRDTKCLEGDIGDWIAKVWPALSNNVQRFPLVLSLANACMPPPQSTTSPRTTPGAPVTTTRAPATTARVTRPTTRVTLIEVVRSGIALTSGAFQYSAPHLASTFFLIIVAFRLGN